jgi:hypothetical protein
VLLLCNTAATVPVTPVPALGVVPAGTVRAGQTGMHGPVQALIPLWSCGNAYKAKPWVSTRTAPKLEVVATSTVEPAAKAVVDAEATMTTATTPTTATTVRRTRATP